MKICTIDIGTNSVLYLLAKIDCIGRLTPLNLIVKTTRLGESLRNKSVLTAKAQKRTITVIKEFLKDAQEKETIHHILTGTSALREARNSYSFIQKLYKETGEHLVVLTENQEAKLALTTVKHFLGTKPGKPPHQYHWCGGKTIIIDIGGGSTELIFCINNTGTGTKSLSIPIGAVNLTEQFGNNIEEIGKFINCKMKNVLSYYDKLKKPALKDCPKGRRKARKKPVELIGIGGTVTTLGAISQRLKNYDPYKVHKCIVTINQLISILKRLNRLSLRERKRIISFDPKRADIILAGLVVLKTFMELFDVKKLKICERGLVYGLALNHFLPISSSQKIKLAYGRKIYSRDIQLT